MEVGLRRRRGVASVYQALLSPTTPSSLLPTTSLGEKSDERTFFALLLSASTKKVDYLSCCLLSASKKLDHR